MGLVLTRKIDQAILIGSDIVVRVISQTGPGAVRLLIEAPRELNIIREELRSQLAEPATPGFGSGRHAQPEAVPPETHAAGPGCHADERQSPETAVQPSPVPCITGEDADGPLTRFRRTRTPPTLPEGVSALDLAVVNVSPDASPEILASVAAALVAHQPSVDERTRKHFGHIMRRREAVDARKRKREEQAFEERQPVPVRSVSFSHFR